MTLQLLLSILTFGIWIHRHHMLCMGRIHVKWYVLRSQLIRVVLLTLLRICAWWSSIAISTHDVQTKLAHLWSRVKTLLVEECGKVIGMQLISLLLWGGMLGSHLNLRVSLGILNLGEGLSITGSEVAWGLILGWNTHEGVWICMPTVPIVEMMTPHMGRCGITFILIAVDAALVCALSCPCLRICRPMWSHSCLFGFHVGHGTPKIILRFWVTLLCSCKSIRVRNLAIWLIFVRFAILRLSSLVSIDLTVILWVRTVLLLLIILQHYKFIFACFGWRVTAILTGRVSLHFQITRFQLQSSVNRWTKVDCLLFIDYLGLALKGWSDLSDCWRWPLLSVLTHMQGNIKIRACVVIVDSCRIFTCFHWIWKHVRVFLCGTSLILLVWDSIFTGWDTWSIDDWWHFSFVRCAMWLWLLKIVQFGLRLRRVVALLIIG